MSEVLVTRNAQRQLDRLTLTVRARIYALLERLEHWPEVSGAKPLQGDRAGRYRMRTGDYRVQFHVEGDRVIVEQIGHRATFYRE